MAKFIKKVNDKFKSKYPSLCGSHTSMIDNKETVKLDDSKKVVLRDDYGVYVTFRDRLDNRLADPNRYNNRVK